MTGKAYTPSRNYLKLAGGISPKANVQLLNAEAIQRAKAYLAQVVKRLQSTMKDLTLSITYDLELGADVASTLVSLAERGVAGKDTGDVASCDLIAISTHGRGGLERWVMGSVTDRILNTTWLPMLTVRPPKT